MAFWQWHEHKLWQDNWNGSSKVDSLGMNDQNQVFINDGVLDYILNRESRFPQSIIMKFPFITNLLSKVHIPIMEKEDACIWSPAEDGILTKKVAYRYKQVAAPILI